MRPTEFVEQTVVLAKDQPEYQPLPVYRCVDGEVISCWRLTWWEAIRLLFTRKLWLRQYTFNTPLQPQLPQIEYPFITVGEKK